MLISAMTMGQVELDAAAFEERLGVADERGRASQWVEGKRAGVRVAGSGVDPEHEVAAGEVGLREPRRGVEVPRLGSGDQSVGRQRVEDSLWVFEDVPGVVDREERVESGLLLVDLGVRERDVID